MQNKAGDGDCHLLCGDDFTKTEPQTVLQKQLSAHRWRPKVQDGYKARPGGRGSFDFKNSKKKKLYFYFVYVPFQKVMTPIRSHVSSASNAFLLGVLALLPTRFQMCGYILTVSRLLLCCCCIIYYFTFCIILLLTYSVKLSIT